MATLTALEDEIKIDNKNQNPFELAISWTPHGSPGDKKYTWALVKPDFPDVNMVGYSSLEIQGSEGYMGKSHYDYPKNIMSLEDFFEGYFENRETSTLFDTFFKSLKKQYIKELVDEKKYNSILTLINNFLVRYVNKFLIYTNKIGDAEKLGNLYKLYMEYTDESMTTYINKYVDQKLDFKNIVNTSDKGFYIAKKKDSEEYVWIFITEEGELKVYEAMRFGFHLIYEDHPYDKFLTLENFFDEYITKESINIKEVEEDKFFESLSPEKLDKRISTNTEYTDTFTKFFEKAKNLFKNKVSKPARLFRLQELYYKFGKIKELAELAELKNVELNQQYLNFLKNKIGSGKEGVELFKECSDPQLYINTTDTKLYLGYCGIFQGYYNSIDYPGNFSEKPELFNLENPKHIKHLENIEIDCRYRIIQDGISWGAMFDVGCANVQDPLNTIREKILDQINKKNVVDTNAVNIYRFLKNNFTEEERETKFSDIEKLKQIHIARGNEADYELVWHEGEIGIISNPQGQQPKFYVTVNDTFVGPTFVGEGVPVNNVDPEKFKYEDLSNEDRRNKILACAKGADGVIKRKIENKLTEYLKNKLDKMGIEDINVLKIFLMIVPKLIISTGIFTEIYNKHQNEFNFLIDSIFNIYVYLEESLFYFNLTTGQSQTTNPLELSQGVEIKPSDFGTLITNLITAIDYLKITNDKIETIKFPQLEGVIDNILTGCSNLDETVKLIKHIKQQDRTANSYFLEKIKKIYTPKLLSKEFLNTPDPPPATPHSLFTLEGDSIKEKWVHFNKIKEEYEEQKKKYIVEYHNYNSQIKQLNYLISIINDDVEYKLPIIDPRKQWDDEGDRGVELQNLRKKLLQMEKEQLEEDLGKFKITHFRKDPAFFVNNAKSLMVLLIENINILLDKTQFNVLLEHIKGIAKTDKEIEQMFAENITIETFSSYIANTGIKEPYFALSWTRRNSGMITFQNLIETLFNSDDVFKFRLNEYEWSWNGVSEKINSSPNPYESYKIFIDNIVKLKQQFLDKTQDVLNENEDGEDVEDVEDVKDIIYYIQLLINSSYMKYEDSLYIIFILEEKGVENLINILPETGRDDNALNKFIENIIKNDIDKNTFIKGLDILYEKHQVNYIEIFEKVILENYEKILEFIEQENKPKCIEDIEEKYFMYEHLRDENGEVFYIKPRSINSFSETPFILKKENYDKKEQKQKNIIRVQKDNQKYYFSYRIKTRTNKRGPIGWTAWDWLTKVEDKNVFILNDKSEMIFINFADLENDAKYKEVSGPLKNLVELLHQPLKVEEYKLTVEISNLYQQKTDELNAEQPDDLTLSFALALGNASTQ